MTSPEGSNFLHSLGLRPDEVAIRKTNKTKLRLFLANGSVEETSDNVLLWTLGKRVRVVYKDSGDAVFDDVIKVLEIKEVWYNRV